MNSSPFIIMSFPRFAGGKFISNCLSLSKHCCPQDSETAKQLLANPTDYDYRLSRVLSTLPKSKSEMINWISRYEFGDVNLYGHTVVSNWQKGIAEPPNYLVQQLIDKGFKLFLVAHGGDNSVRNLYQSWPGSFVVKLINHTRFSQIAQRCKSPNDTSIDKHAGNYCKTKYLKIAGESWPDWEEFESVGYDIQKLAGYDSVQEEILRFYNWKNIGSNTALFDIDNAIFSRTKFLTAMERLYEQLELTDYRPALIEQFWKSYMLLHVDNVDMT